MASGARRRAPRSAGIQIYILSLFPGPPLSLALPPAPNIFANPQPLRGPLLSLVAPISIYLAPLSLISPPPSNATA